MSSGTRTQLRSLDDALDRADRQGDLPGALFAVVDLLDRQPGLRRALTDPGTSDDRRRGLVHAVLDGRIGPAAVDLVADAAAQRWPGGRSFSDAVERMAVRAVLMAANDQGRLDEVEDQLFRFDRTVSGDVGLRGAIADRTADLDRRRTLVATLLDDRSAPETSRLAQRAVGARERSFAVTLESYVALAAQIRDRVVATVRVARPLDGEQTERLQRALSRQVGRDVALQVIVEPDLLGGVRVELGDEVIDGTVSSKLADAGRMFG